MQTSIVHQHYKIERYRKARASLLRCIKVERAEGYTIGPRHLQGELAKLRRAYWSMAQ